MIITPKFEKSGIPLLEYPRPQLKRDSYLCLNGEWEYAFTNGQCPAVYDGKIIVPYSPETELSGVNRQLKSDQTLYYKRDFCLPNDFNRGRILLNFGAVDQECTVFINGISVGENKGGYLPFSFDITDYIKDQNQIVVAVTDDASSPVHARGKQKYKRGGIWYTATSGIWQTVWLESVPQSYIKDLRLTTDFDNKTLKVDCEFVGDINEITVEVLDGDTLLYSKSGKNGLVLYIPDCKPWSTDTPELYTVKVTVKEDKVESYFGLRKISLKNIDGYTVTLLNDTPIFYNGILDQGYFQGGYYTPKTNADFYDEIKRVKDLGFNMLRKHAKVEPLLWYYYCDVLGVTVWQDMVNGGAPYKTLRIMLAPFINLHLNDNNYKSMGRNEQSRSQYMKDSLLMQKTLYNCPSVCVYTPFNEGWGQFDAVNVTKILRENDPTRLYDHASGWQDMGAGDFNSKHIYFRKLRLKKDERALTVSEFGGYSYAYPEHTFAKRTFGYKIFKDNEKLNNAYKKLYRLEVIPEIEKNGLCATVYTQLTDVEDEINGIFTFDRVLKLCPQMLKEINSNIQTAFKKKFDK